MTHDELADYFKVGFDELHAKVDAMEDGPFKRKLERRVDAFHAAADWVRNQCADEGLIQPFSGGDPKTP